MINLWRLSEITGRDIQKVYTGCPLDSGFQGQLSNHPAVLPFQGVGAERQGNVKDRMKIL
jgi:hypothetical protein